ncbi:hypothetical protein ACJX0J_032092, partial [Zea mays]
YQIAIGILEWQRGTIGYGMSRITIVFTYMQSRKDIDFSLLHLGTKEEENACLHANKIGDISHFIQTWYP